MIYGKGGVGKTTLAATAPNSLLIDLEGGAEFMDVPRVTREQVPTLAVLLAALQSNDFDEFHTLVIDSVTRVEELLTDHVLDNYPVSGSGGATQRASDLEAYGYGKGYSMLYDEYCRFLGALERLAALGKNIVLVAHEITETVSNPGGADYRMLVPRIYQGKGKSACRSRVIEAMDHVAHVAYDQDVVVADPRRQDKPGQVGKVRGSGSRTVYFTGEASREGKTRCFGLETWDFVAPSTDQGRAAAAELWRMLTIKQD